MGNDSLHGHSSQDNTVSGTIVLIIHTLDAISIVAVGHLDFQSPTRHLEMSIIGVFMSFRRCFLILNILQRGKRFIPVV